MTENDISYWMKQAAGVATQEQIAPGAVPSMDCELKMSDLELFRVAVGLRKQHGAALAKLHQLMGILIDIDTISDTEPTA